MNFVDVKITSLYTRHCQQITKDKEGIPLKDDREISMLEYLFLYRL